MEQTAVKLALAAVDEIVKEHSREVERLKEAFAYRVKHLEHERRRESLNPVLYARIDRARDAASKARSVHDRYSSMLTALLRFSRSALTTQLASPEAPGAPATITIREFAQLYTLLGYANAARTQVLATATLREIFETGKLADASPRVKAFLKVGGEVAADEALKYSGADSAQNMAKVVKVLADARAAMNVSGRAMQDVSRWLDQLDAAEHALQDWLHIVNADLENIERNIKAIIQQPPP